MKIENSRVLFLILAHFPMFSLLMKIHFNSELLHDKKDIGSTIIKHADKIFGRR